MRTLVLIACDPRALAVLALQALLLTKCSGEWSGRPYWDRP